MTSSYYYSITTDFDGNSNNLKSSQLHAEILLETGITTTLVAVNTNGDQVEIIFNGTLSGAEQTLLDGVVADHVPDISKRRDVFFSVTPKKTAVNSNNWTVCSVFKYDGSNVIGLIDYIELISYMNNGITSYDARVVNRDNGNVLAQKTGMTNEILATYDLGTVSNIPTATSMLELQIRKNGGNSTKYIEIEQLLIYYGNVNK